LNFDLILFKELTDNLKIKLLVFKKLSSFKDKEESKKIFSNALITLTFKSKSLKRITSIFL